MTLALCLLPSALYQRGYISMPIFTELNSMRTFSVGFISLLQQIVDAI
jgi:hypothetical protein